LGCDLGLETWGLGSNFTLDIHSEKLEIFEAKILKKMEKNSLKSL
jgi:hypothetical protein